MKRRYATAKNADCKILKIDNKIFSGYACKLKFTKDVNPLIVFNGIEYSCIRDKDYTMYELYRDNTSYALTIMFDDKDNLIEWYFDVSKQIGVENGIPYEDDLYLDLVVTPDGKYMVLDEDELLEAKSNNLISEGDVEHARKVLDELINTYTKDLDVLNKLTEFIKEKFSENICE